MAVGQGLRRSSPAPYFGIKVDEVEGRGQGKDDAGDLLVFRGGRDRWAAVGGMVRRWVPLATGGGG